MRNVEPTRRAGEESSSARAWRERAYEREEGVEGRRGRRVTREWYVVEWVGGAEEEEEAEEELYGMGQRTEKWEEGGFAGL